MTDEEQETITTDVTHTIMRELDRRLGFILITVVPKGDRIGCSIRSSLIADDAEYKAMALTALEGAIESVNAGILDIIYEN